MNCLFMSLSERMLSNRFNACRILMILMYLFNVFINSDHKRIQECSISVKGRVICNQHCLESDQPGV